jgi:putative NADPH-quinone reductase
LHIAISRSEKHGAVRTFSGLLTRYSIDLSVTSGFSQHQFKYSSVNYRRLQPTVKATFSLWGFSPSGFQVYSPELQAVVYISIYQFKKLKIVH